MKPAPTASADFLKAHDSDRYFASLIIPEVHRSAVQALYAFNADIAAIPARVSEPAPGEIRLRWWHDALEGVDHGQINQNPIAAEFLAAVKHYKLPTGPLLRLIAARRFDLYQDPMPDLETFEGYAGETNSVLYQYAAMILADGDETGSGDAAGHLGVAHALIGHMRAFGFNAAQGRVFLPLSVFLAHGANDRHIFVGKTTPQIVAALAQLREIATSHLQKAHAAIKQSPKAQRAAFAAITLLRADIKALQAQVSPFVVPQPKAEWRKIMALVIWAMRNA